MTFTTRTDRRLVKKIALGFALAAIAVPTASAADYSNDGPTSGPTIGQLVTVDAPRQGPSAQQLPGQYSFDGPRAGGPVGADQSQYSHDGPRSGPATTLPAFPIDAPRSAPLAVPTVAPLAVPTTTGIDWRSVGIGAALGLAFAALTLGALHLIGRRRHQHLAGI